MEINHNIAAYAGYLNDCDELLECSSGGIGTALARYMIHNGGYVAGVGYSDDFKSSEYQIINDNKGINRLKGSKYIVANKKSVYQDIKLLLDQNEKVLFFGTPCVVAALVSYLKKTMIISSPLS